MARELYLKNPTETPTDLFKRETEHLCLRQPLASLLLHACAPSFTSQ